MEKLSGAGRNSFNSIESRETKPNNDVTESNYVGHLSKERIAREREKRHKNYGYNATTMNISLLNSKIGGLLCAKKPT